MPTYKYHNPDRSSSVPKHTKFSKLVPIKPLSDALTPKAQANVTVTGISHWIDPSLYLDEWQRVLDMRFNNDPLIFGGLNHDPSFKPKAGYGGRKPKYDKEVTNKNSKYFRRF